MIIKASNIMNFMAMTFIIIAPSSIGFASSKKTQNQSFVSERYRYVSAIENHSVTIGKIIKAAQSMDGYYLSLSSSEVKLSLPLKNAANFAGALEKIIPTAEHSMVRDDRTSAVNKTIASYKIAKDALKQYYKSLQTVVAYERLLDLQAAIDNEIQIAENAESNLRNFHNFVNRALFTVSLSNLKAVIEQTYNEDNLNFSWMEKMNVDNLLEFQSVFPSKTKTEPEIYEIDQEPGEIEEQFVE